MGKLTKRKVKNYYILAYIIKYQSNGKEEAIECLDLCIKLNPNYESAYEKKG